MIPSTFVVGKILYVPNNDPGSSRCVAGPQSSHLLSCSRGSWSTLELSHLGILRSDSAEGREGKILPNPGIAFIRSARAKDCRTWVENDILLPENSSIHVEKLSESCLMPVKLTHVTSLQFSSAFYAKWLIGRIFSLEDLSFESSSPSNSWVFALLKKPAKLRWPWAQKGTLHPAVGIVGGGCPGGQRNRSFVERFLEKLLHLRFPKKETSSSSLEIEHPAN